MYEQQNAALDILLSNPWLADILVKVSGDEELSAAEHQRYMAYLYQRVNLWEMAYYWHRDDHMSADSWVAWEQVFTFTLKDWLPSKVWSELRPVYDSEFAAYVDLQYGATQ